MPRMILPADKMKRIIRQRQLNKADRKDEVWNGVYVMSPDLDNVHQILVGRLAFAISAAYGDDRTLVLAGANITDRADDWTKNYRCPDVLVFLPGNPAEDRETHYLGGPDFAAEIISRGRSFPQEVWLLREGRRS